MESAAHWYKTDAALKNLPFDKYSKPAPADVVDKVKAALEAKKFVVHVVENREEALQAIKKLVPKVYT